MDTKFEYPDHLKPVAEAISKKEFGVLPANKVLDWWFPTWPRPVMFTGEALAEAVACAKSGVEAGLLQGGNVGYAGLDVVRKIRYDSDKDNVMASVEVLPSKEGLAFLEMAAEGIKVEAYPVMEIYGFGSGEGDPVLFFNGSADVVDRCRILSVCLTLAACTPFLKDDLKVYIVHGVLKINLGQE